MVEQCGKILYLVVGGASWACAGWTVGAAVGSFKGVVAAGVGTKLALAGSRRRRLVEGMKEGASAESCFCELVAFGVAAWERCGLV